MDTVFAVVIDGDAIVDPKDGDWEIFIIKDRILKIKILGRDTSKRFDLDAFFDLGLTSDEQPDKACSLVGMMSVVFSPFGELGVVGEVFDLLEEVGLVTAKALVDLFEDLGCRLCLDTLTGHIVVRFADLGKEESEIVIDLGQRTDGTTFVADAFVLLDSDGWAESCAVVEIWTIAQLKKLSQIRGERLDVSVLSLFVDRSKRKR